MFRGAGSEGDGGGAVDVSVCGRWMFRGAGNLDVGADSE